MRLSYVIVHDRSSKQKHSCIVGPLYPIDITAVESRMRAVVEMVILAHQTDGLSSIERLFGPVRIRAIFCL